VFDERALAERFRAKPLSIHEAPMSANPKARTDVWLYVANLSLLATHQADAAYWHEWDVFGVPGDLPFFLLFTVAAVALLATGLVRVAEGAPAARSFAWLCAGVGLFTCALHAVFLWLDHTAFWAPESLGLLLAVLLTSIAQLLRLPPRKEGQAG
jgi:hypothetical protein